MASRAEIALSADFLIMSRAAAPGLLASSLPSAPGGDVVAKQHLRRAADMTLGQAMAAEVEALLACMATVDWADGVAAFSERWQRPSPVLSERDKVDASIDRLLAPAASRSWVPRVTQRSGVNEAIQTLIANAFALRSQHSMAIAARWSQPG